MQSLIGHRDTIQALERMVANGSLPHAMLFVGPNHVGKTTIAEWLAKRLLCNCSQQSRRYGRDPDTKSSGPIADSRPYAEARPCGVCPMCTQVVRGVHPDVMRIGDGGTISVEMVRVWNSAIASSSLFGGWKIGIVERADQFTEEAANACLKTIEEPPKRTVLILTTTQRRSVLPTIASRCATMRCRRVADSELFTGLTDRSISSVDAERFTRAAGGCPGLAVAWAHTPDQWESQTKREQLARDILCGSYAERIRRVDQFVRGLPEDRTAAQAMIADLLQIFRSISHEFITRIAEGTACDEKILRPSELIQWMNAIIRAPRELAANVAPRLVLESIVLTYP